MTLMEQLTITYYMDSRIISSISHLGIYYVLFLLFIEIHSNQLSYTYLHINCLLFHYCPVDLRLAYSPRYLD